MKLKPIVPLMSLIFAATLTGCNLDGSSDGSSSSSGGSTETDSGLVPEIEDDVVPYVDAVDYSALTVTTVVDDAATLSSAVTSASAGDVIGLKTSGDYSALGALVIDKMITLVSVDSSENIIDPQTSDEKANITSSSCIFIDTAGSGSQILNLSFDNDNIGANAECVLSGSTGRSGVIAIAETNDQEPVILDNLSFDAIKITDQDASLNNKSSWVYTEGQLELTNSQFINLASNLENNAVYTSCSKGASRNGSVIASTIFSINGSSTSQTSAVKIGESSSGATKDNPETKACNFNLSNNVFYNYLTRLDTDISDTSKRPIAIWAYASALTTDDNNIIK